MTVRLSLIFDLGFYKIIKVVGLIIMLIFNRIQYRNQIAQINWYKLTYKFLAQQRCTQASLKTSRNLPTTKEHCNEIHDAKLNT